jgi:hypothetical protein
MYVDESGDDGIDFSNQKSICKYMKEKYGKIE